MNYNNNNNINNYNNDYDINQNYNNDYNDYNQKQPENDFNYFANENNNQPQSVSSMNDTNIMGNIMEENNNFTNILSNRIRCLQNVASSWSKGNIEESIAAISMSKDLGATNDFINNAIIKKNLTKVSIKPDQAIQLFPMILALSKSRYDVYFCNGIQSAWVILKLYYDVIIEAKNTTFVSGIDLNREDKIKKYDVLVDYFFRLRDLDSIKNHLRKNSTFEGLNLNQFTAEVEYFIKMCRQHK